MAKTWKETTWAGRPNYECEECPFATLEADDMVTHAMKVHGARARSSVRSIGELAGINFASDEAAELAAALVAAGRLAAPHFDFPPSGRTGGFTVADVRTAAADSPAEGE